MRAVNSGNTYTIYDNSIQLLTSLPAQTYLVNFDKQSGFFLTKLRSHSRIAEGERRVFL